jgi:hypothetical protein
MPRASVAKNLIKYANPSEILTNPEREYTPMDHASGPETVRYCF